MRLEPRVFWAMSLVEWRASVSRLAPQAPLARAELMRMMKEFPDG